MCEGDSHPPQGLRLRDSPEGVRGNIPGDYCACLDDRPFSNSDIRKDDTVGTYKDILLDNDFTRVIFFFGAPVEM